MNAMTKAHEIRKAAAAKFNCDASEIHSGECLRMAHNNEEVEVKEIVTEEIWNKAAAIHTRGQSGLMTLVNKTAAKIDSTDFLTIADHLYGEFLKQQDRPGGAGHFGLFLNLMHK